MSKEAASPYSTVAKFLKKGLNYESMVTGLKKMHGLSADDAAKMIKNVKNKPRGVVNKAAIKNRKMVADATRVVPASKTKYVSGASSGYIKPTF